MKKLFVFAIAIISFAAVQGQDKITRTGVVGKWKISSLEMPNMLSYNLETDSLALGDMIKAQLTDPSQLQAARTQIKTQLGMMAKMAFEFKADGTAVLNEPTGEAQAATYTVDEDKSTITTEETTGGKSRQTLDANIVDGKLRLKLPSPSGEIFLLLKKA